MIDFIRNKGKERQGEVWEDTHLVEVHKNGGKYHVLLYTHDKRYIEYECDHFVNALGYSAERFARMLGSLHRPLSGQAPSVDYPSPTESG